MQGHVHPMGKPYRGVLGEKEELNRPRFWHRSYKCPGGRDHFWKARQGELRQLHQRSQGQAGGWMPSSARRRNPRAKQGQRDYGGKQGLLARVEMGRAQPLLCTQPYTQKTPPHRRPYVTLCPGPLQSPVFLHNSPFLMAGGKLSPPKFPWPNPQPERKAEMLVKKKMKNILLTPTRRGNHSKPVLKLARGKLQIYPGAAEFGECVPSQTSPPKGMDEVHPFSCL